MRTQDIQAKLTERGLRLGPTLSAPAVAAFETSHGITLPSDYRAFLLELGNGGAGPPSYGLLPLGATPQHQVPEWFLSGYESTLKHPFPLEEAWVWEGEAPAPDVEHRIQALRFGNLCLGTDGCGLFWHLIVTGPQRGQVWQIADVGATPLAPPHSFSSWYLFWLEGGTEWFADL